jgi:predicted small integral membrane protein
MCCSLDSFLKISIFGNVFDFARGYVIIERHLKTHNQFRIRTIGGIDLGPKKSGKLGYLQAFRNKAFVKIHNQHSPIWHIKSKIMT